MMVTTGGRGSNSMLADEARSWSSIMSSFRRTAVWPNSSTTSWAVSWSIGWLIVAITPIFIMVLMTSFALTAMRLASSPTVMVSGNWTSRLTGAVGNSKPWRLSTLTCAVRRKRFGGCFFLKRALGVRRNVQFLAAVLRGRRALAGARSGAARSGARPHGYGAGAAAGAARGAAGRIGFAMRTPTGSAARRSPSLRSRSARSRACCSACGRGVGVGAAPCLVVRLAARFGFEPLALALLGRAALGFLPLRFEALRFFSALRAVDFFLPRALLFLEHGAIQVGFLATHLDRDRARTALRGRELDLLLRLALQRDLARGRGLRVAPVRAAQERQEFHLRVVADDVVLRCRP